MKNINKFIRSANLATGYTLMELIIAGIILGIITAVALPSFKNMMEKQYCKTAQMNLAAIYTAAKTYQIKHRTYKTPNDNLTGINTDLKLHIDDPKFTYMWFSSATDYTALAIRTGGPAYQCFLNYAFTLSSTNPSCTSAQYCGTTYLDR